jgi:hypothetical protein
MNDITNLNVDFPQMIKDLKDKKQTLEIIADRSGCSVPTVRKLRDVEGTRPSWALAGTIIQLHTYWCGSGAVTND